MPLSPNILIGPAGWSYKDWEGVVYPSTLKKLHPVEYLARYFDTIEINSSFYGHIKPEVGLLWARKAHAVNKRFFFTAKLNKCFTHSPMAVVEPTSARTIRPYSDDEKLAKLGLDALAGRDMLGAVLAQFPISFRNTNENRDYLDSLLARFAAYPMVVEVRHTSWNNEGTLRYFAKQRVSFCNIDMPQLGRAIPPTEHVTAPIAYVRLHGRNYAEWFAERDPDAEESAPAARRDARYNYLYSGPELREWKHHIDRIGARSRVTFVITNNHFQGKAAVNALQLKHMYTDALIPVPEPLIAHYWELEQIAETPTNKLF